MSDLIMPLIDEKDPFLREVPHRFDFDSPHEDPDKLEKRLIDNMYHYNGIGLSSNQIGIPTKVFAMISDGDPMAVFNPEIVEWSDEEIYEKEGCLSFPYLFFSFSTLLQISKIPAYRSCGDPNCYRPGGDTFPDTPTILKIYKNFIFFQILQISKILAYRPCGLPNWGRPGGDKFPDAATIFKIRNFFMFIEIDISVYFFNFIRSFFDLIILN